jgi:hypothetical protein
MEDFSRMRVSHRGPARLLASPGAVRAQALAIIATLQLGLAAATTAHPEPPAPAPVDLALWLADPQGAVPLLGVPSATTGRAKAAKVTPRTPGTLGLPSLAPVKPKPAPKKPQAKPVRYVPQGTGMWTYQWGETEGGNAKKVVAKAKAYGLSHLYVRTGTRAGGFDGGPMLKKLLPATQGTDIKIIAWDFPQLKNPKKDAARLAAAARYRVPGAPRVAAVAPDIETGAEGTKLSAKNVDVYMKTLRRLLPADVSIIGVTPWPSEKRVGHYPFDTVAKYSDALAPMAYWVNRDPATVAKQTMQRFAKYKKPVMPIGQAYDPRIDVPTLSVGAPSRADVRDFLKTADKYGAPSASLWVWQFAHKSHWTAIQYARPLYEEKPGRKK